MSKLTPKNGDADLLDPSGLKLPRRPYDAHKGNFGRALLLCGAQRYPGAARLAALGCLTAGAGLVTLGVPESTYPALSATCPPEIMLAALPQDEKGQLAPSSYLDHLVATADACLFGPGWGRSAQLDALARHLWNTFEGPLIADADGLNSLAGHILVETGRPRLLTPHAGEFARLFAHLPAPGSAETARCAARESHALVVYKGHGTLTASPDGQVYANPSGNPGMATGGTGDLLAGLLCGLWVQKAASPRLFASLDWLALTALGVYLHGKAGDRAAETMGEYALTPSAMAAVLPVVIKESTL